jgi:hypothetical protein
MESPLKRNLAGMLTLQALVALWQEPAWHGRSMVQLSHHLSGQADLTQRNDADLSKKM